MFEQVLNEVTQQYEGKIQMYKVDIEEEPQLAAQFGARSIPFTVMISKSGERDSNTGSMTADQLKYYAQRNITFSTHIHISVDSPDRAIKITNATVTLFI